MKRLSCSLLLLTLAPLATTTAQELGTQRLAIGLQNPGFMSQAPGDDDRMFIFERRRGIRILKDGALLPTLFLDLSAEMGSNEAGTCFAFHPDYQNNGRFFVMYMDAAGDSHVAEYAVTANPDIADPNSRIQVLGPEPQPSPIHNWDCIKFGPDGMLYASMGDGVLVNNNVTNNAQDLSNTFGSILRLDMDLPFPHVPADNPFVGQPGVDERIWLYGVRQPWRFAFDPLNDDLYIADVGRISWEEINVIPGGAGAGKNLGWRCLEGDECTNYGGGGCLSCGDSSYVPPVFAYPHDGSPISRCAIIGGEVYRGSAIPSLYGCYFYADYCTGQFWSFKWDGSQITEHVERTAELIPDLGGPIDFPTSFAVDNAGELYILSNGGGELYKIVEVNCESQNYCSSAINSAGTMATIGMLGSSSVAANDMILNVHGSVPLKIGIYFYGPNQIQVPFGAGFRCVGGSIFRISPASAANGSGYDQLPLDLTAPPLPSGQITAGSTWNFQYWYRDPAGTADFNLTDAMEVAFCP